MRWRDQYQFLSEIHKPGTHSFKHMTIKIITEKSTLDLGGGMHSIEKKNVDFCVYVCVALRLSRIK
jgi:hypothetical protein